MLQQLPYKKIILGVLNFADTTIETPEIIADRIRRALVYRDPKVIIIAPDCCSKYLHHHSAFGKMKAMVEGARIVRAELGG